MVLSFGRLIMLMVLIKTIHTELFYSKEDAEYYVNNIGSGNYCKIYQTVDIWNWVPRHFSEVLSGLANKFADTPFIEEIDEEGRITEYSLKEEITLLFDLYDMTGSANVEWVFNNYNLVIYAVSVAWIWDNKLYHENWTIEVC